MPKEQQTSSLTTSAEPELPRASSGRPSRRPAAAETEWEKKVLEPTLEKSPERANEFTTISDYPIRRLYTPADLDGW